jgi:type II secretory pathway pseudopilin PulG
VRMMQSRRALSLVEVVVALCVVGVVAAALVTALAGDRRLRDLAAAHDGAARRTRARLEQLASRACTNDTSGSTLEAWGAESWRAIAGGGAWRLSDSLALRRSTAVLVIDARVACPE